MTSLQNTIKTFQSLQETTKDLIELRLTHLDFAKNELISNLNLKCSRIFKYFLNRLDHCPLNEVSLINQKIARLGKLSEKIHSMIKRKWELQAFSEETIEALINQIQEIYNAKTAIIVRNAIVLFKNMACEKYLLGKILTTVPKRAFTQSESKNINNIISALKTVQKHVLDRAALPKYTHQIRFLLQHAYLLGGNHDSDMSNFIDL